MASHSTSSVQETADRLAIGELIDAYAHCADRRDAKGQMNLFTDDTRFVVYLDATADQPTQELRGREGGNGRWCGRRAKEFRAWNAILVCGGWRVNDSRAAAPRSRSDFQHDFPTIVRRASEHFVRGPGLIERQHGSTRQGALC